MLQAVQKSRGFTLVELLVSITIVAILATVGFSIYFTAIRSARDGKRVADVLEVQKAIEQYYAINRSYPSVGTLSDTVPNLAWLSTYFADGHPPSDPNPTAFSPAYEYRYYSCVLPPTPSEHYIVCAKLESPNGKANRTSLPTNGCDPVTEVGGSVYYCVGSLSN